MNPDISRILSICMTHGDAYFDLLRQLIASDLPLKGVLRSVNGSRSIILGRRVSAIGGSVAENLMK